MTLYEKEIMFLPGYFARSDGTIRTPDGVTEGFIASNGYRSICIGDKFRYVHRLIARTLVNNAAPYVFGTVDHKNNDRLCNLPGNLRWCTQAMNLLNRKAKNAYWDKRKRKWKSKFRSGGKFKNCGYYDTFEKAHEAARKGKLKMFRFLFLQGKKLNEEILNRDFCP
jgi:hypothetical protein